MCDTPGMTDSQVLVPTEIIDLQASTTTDQQPIFVTEGFNDALCSEEVYKLLDEAVNELDLGISWQVFTEEYCHWNIPLTLKEFHKIYDLVSTGLARKKLWLAAPIIAAYFNCAVYNWDDPIWAIWANDPTVIVEPHEENYGPAESRWSAVYDQDSGKMFGYRYNAAKLWHDLCDRKSASGELLYRGMKFMRLHVKYNRVDANSICCYRKLYTRYKPEEIKDIEEMIKTQFSEAD